MNKKVLIIDDDTDMCGLLQRFLNRNGYEAETSHSANKGLEKFKTEIFDIVICDFRLGDKKNGKDILLEIKQHKSSTIVLIITGYSDIRTAVDVIKAGAYNYIIKPLIPEEVLAVLSEAINQPVIRNEQTVLIPVVVEKSTKFKTVNSEYLEGKDIVTKQLYQQVDLVAPTNYSVVLYGESGTGKEVIAKTIHERSNRKGCPFIAMDCGTLSNELAGSELFGHVKGAFTGALADKEGQFELANGGTLFLDEVANLSPEIQSLLLRVIQERKFKRVGSNKEIEIDIRIIVASNENLQEAHRKGKFREDLYYRFNEFAISLPPLRNRKNEIPLFAEFFLAKTVDELNKQLDGFDDEVMKKFMDYSWPGNLREFKNVIRRCALLTESGYIGVSSLPQEICSNVIDSPSYKKEADHATISTLGLKDSASKAEYDTIMHVLKEVNFNKTKAADLLKIDRKTLYSKIKSYQNLNL
jgi:two-component system response regulator HydG